jgi:hypothetical protein
VARLAAVYHRWRTDPSKLKLEKHHERQDQGPCWPPSGLHTTRRALIEVTGLWQHRLNLFTWRNIMKINTKVRAGRPPACGATPPLLD